MKKLTLVLLFALLASACGGSDEASSPVEDAVAADDAATTDGDTAVTSDDNADDGPDDGTDDGTDDGEPPEPIQFVPAVERDCAHTTAELGLDEGDGEAIEVELPPDEKPAIEDDYLGSFDELMTEDLIEGSGDAATAGSTVTMRYVGVLGADGTEFDASYNSGTPFTFLLGAGQVIPGWDQGIEGMNVGGRRLLQIPSALAYGDTARGEIIAADSDLVFVVDLLDVAAGPQPAPPIDDTYLGAVDELEIIDLVEGEGCAAEVGDVITVNYVGIDAADGAEFDSSWSRGEPFAIVVGRSQVIDGWNEGILGMNVGGERILRIPAALAYDDGDLVFRVHLEGLVEAPLAHRVEFEGDAPTEVEVTTLVEGSGDEAAPGSIVDANIVVRMYKSNVILQSTYQQGGITQLALQEGTLLPGLESSILGTQVGETRQIVLPASVAYPDGVPPESGIEDDDALVFIIEPLRITQG